METTKFSDYANAQELTGEKMKMEDVIDKAITVKASKTLPDKFAKKEGDTVTLIQFELDGKDHVVFTRSGVLISQLHMMKDKLPFSATIVKQKRYLTFK